MIPSSGKKNSNGRNSETRPPILPNTVSFRGPAIVEQWSDRMMLKRENFSFRDYLDEHSETRNEFVRHLKTIVNSKEQDEGNFIYPKDLRSSADDVLKMINNHKSGDRASEINVMKNTTKNVWIAMPACYCQFMQPEKEDTSDTNAEPYTEMNSDEQDMWRNALGRVLDPYAKPMPIIAKYAKNSAPWAAIIGDVDPLKLNIVFDDRYFMVSNEINMLNAMLFEDDGDKDCANT